VYIKGCAKHHGAHTALSRKSVHRKGLAAVHGLGLRSQNASERGLQVCTAGACILVVVSFANQPSFNSRPTNNYPASWTTTCNEKRVQTHLRVPHVRTPAVRADAGQPEGPVGQHIRQILQHDARIDKPRCVSTAAATLASGNNPNPNHLPFPLRCPYSPFFSSAACSPYSQHLPTPHCRSGAQ
jgi:hypothetical protein